MILSLELIDCNFEDDRKIMNGADCFVLPSNFPDLGMSYNETMLYLKLKKHCLETGKALIGTETLLDHLNLSERQLWWTVEALENLNAIEKDCVNSNITKITLTRYEKIKE